MKTMKTKHLLLLGIIVILSIPLMSIIGAEFEGTDDQGANMVLAMNPSYEPWVEPLWEPGSDRAENILFFLQGAVGVVLIGSYFYSKGKNRQDKEV